MSVNVSIESDIMLLEESPETNEFFLNRTSNSMQGARERSFYYDFVAKSIDNVTPLLYTILVS